MLPPAPMRRAARVRESRRQLWDLRASRPYRMVSECGDAGRAIPSDGKGKLQTVHCNGAGLMPAPPVASISPTMIITPDVRAIYGYHFDQFRWLAITRDAGQLFLMLRTDLSLFNFLA